MRFFPGYVPAVPAPVGIQEMLAARDSRVCRQERLRKEYGQPMVSFTMNLPGEYKRSPAADLLFLQGLELLEAEAGIPLHAELVQKPTGLEAAFIYAADAVELKKTCRSVEESFPAARLFDMDVVDASGRKLSAEDPRRCLVCGRPARECARSRAHGLAAVLASVNGLLRGWLPERIAELAVDSLKEEALLSPKPGLVDRLNPGAHGDMNISLMLQSAESLRGYFKACAEAGLAFADMETCDYPAFMGELKTQGILAEETMLRVTGGVNTHRGAIYLLGILSAALAFHSIIPSEGDALQIASRLASSADNLLPGSHGETVRGICPKAGPRFEARSGFPLVKTGVYKLSDALLRGFAPEDAQLETLLELMLLCDDSNILYRGGTEGLAYTRSIAAEILDLPVAERSAALVRADAAMTQKRLSPGGAADLLAASMFMLSASPLL